MRIVHVTSSLDPASGGPANVLARLAPVQVQRGHTVTIITADAPSAVSDIAAQLRSAGVGVEPKGPGHGPICRAPATVEALKRLMDAGLDLMHAHGLWQYPVHWSASACRRAGLPYIIRPCGMLDPWCLAQGRLKKRAFLAVKARKDLNSAAAIHYTTETERRLTEPLDLRPTPYIIPNGLDWSEFEHLPRAGAFREKYSVGDRPLVVFLSRLHPKKGLDLLLPAFASGAPADAILALVGPSEDGYLRDLRAEAEQLGISDRLIITGMLKGPDRIEALADADLFTLPSYQENFGVAVIEAAGAGTPVLISDQVNICSEVEAAQVGRVIPCDTDQLAAALGDMLADRDALHDASERCRAWAKNSFAWGSIVDRVDEMYRGVMVERDAPRRELPV